MSAAPAEAALLSRASGSDAAAFRGAFGRWATGVAVATCEGPEGPAGVTVNSLSSVSLDPPMALFCLEEGARTLPMFLAAGHFALNILAEDQRAASNHFAAETAFRPGDEADRWLSGAPLLAGTLAVADCRLLDTHGGGDHVILLGEVLEVGWREGAAPLLYYGGGYRNLGP